jgi:nucleoside-diphosphate-sugar epimerase
MSSAPLPDDFTYVFHAAVDFGHDDWEPCVETNAQASGNLLYHCRQTKGFVFCSTGSF